MIKKINENTFGFAFLGSEIKIKQMKEEVQVFKDGKYVKSFPELKDFIYYINNLTDIGEIFLEKREEEE